MATVLEPILTSLHGREVGLSRGRRMVVRGEPDQVAMTAGVGTTNQTLVTLQAINNEGANHAAVLEMTLWLSDAATGVGLTATTASGAVGAGASGTDLGALTTKKALRVLTDAGGKYILAITDTAKTAFNVCATLDKARRITPNVYTLATASYG